MPARGFFAVAADDPGRTALVDAAERSYTYGELAAHANAYGRGLRAVDIGDGDTVALVLRNSVELVELFVATMQIGARLVVVNWHLTPEEIAYLLGDSGARVVVADETSAAVATDACDRARVALEARYCTTARGGFVPLPELRAGRSEVPLDDRRPGQVMFYTSGTTGRPKGVRKTVPDVAPGDLTLQAGLGMVRELPPPEPDMVHLVGGPLYHAAPLASVAGALDLGALLVLMDRFTPERWLELVAHHRVTHVSMVPTMFHRLLALPDDVRENVDVSSLRAVSHAGAPCGVELKRRTIEWLGPIVTEYYSATEGGGTLVTSEEWLARPGTVGRAMPGVSVRILDDDGAECPAGEPGHVYLSPTMWEFEYHRDAAKTEANRRDGLFTVGDIGYLDDNGYLFLCDREAEIINSGGVNIYPAEVEARLLDHPTVADAAVIGVPDEEWGESVRALVEVAPGTRPDDELAATLVAWCRDGIAHYKCPRAVDFLDSLHRDPNGKLRKSALRAPYWAGHARHI